MKHIYLYIFVFIATCATAQQLNDSGSMQTEEYSISETSSNNTDPTISIFPNPTTDFINIEDKEGVISKATIFNLLGKEIATIQVINGVGTYDMMGHHKGVYLVQLKDKKDQVFQTIRLKKI